MWSYDRTVTIEKPLVTAPWRSFGFYALTGKSTISFGERITKETVCEVLEGICAQNPASWILLVADNYGGLIIQIDTGPGRRTRHRVRLHPAVFADTERDRTAGKSLKREIPPEIFENRDHFRQLLTETFLRLSHRVSFAVDWIDKFLPNIQRLR